MNNVILALQAAGNVLGYGLLLGAGLPALFAVGVKSLAIGRGEDIGNDKAHPAGISVATLCFALVVIFVLMGLAIIVSSGMGMKVSIEHYYPTFVPKK